MRIGHRKQSVAAVFGAVCALWALSAQAQPPGSAERRESRNFSQGELEISTTPWRAASGADLRGWFERHKAYAFHGRSVGGAPKVKKRGGESGGYFALRNTGRGSNGADIYSLVVACEHEGRRRLVEAAGPKVLFKKAKSPPLSYAVSAVERYCQEATTTAQTAPQTVAKPTAHAGAGLREIRGVLTYGLQQGGLFGPTTGFIALLDDGTYTEELRGLFNARGLAGGVPREGAWRFSGDKLHLKENGDAAFEAVSNSWLVQPARRGEKLNGCYYQLSSSDGLGMGPIVGSVKDVCFTKDGRFTLDRSSFIAGSGGGVAIAGASSSPNRYGAYELNGHVLALSFASGEKAWWSFGRASDEHLMLEGERFLDR